MTIEAEVQRVLDTAPLRRRNARLPFEPIAERSYFRKQGEAVEEIVQQIGAPHRSADNDGVLGDWRCPLKSFFLPHHIDRAEGTDAIAAIAEAIAYLDSILRVLVENGEEIYHDRECQISVTKDNV